MKPLTITSQQAWILQRGTNLSGELKRLGRRLCGLPTSGDSSTAFKECGFLLASAGFDPLMVRDEMIANCPFNGRKCPTLKHGLVIVNPRLDNGSLYKAGIDATVGPWNPGQVIEHLILSQNPLLAYGLPAVAQALRGPRPDTLDTSYLLDQKQLEFLLPLFPSMITSNSGGYSVRPAPFIKFVDQHISGENKEYFQYLPGFENWGINRRLAEYYRNQEENTKPIARMRNFLKSIRYF